MGVEFSTKGNCPWKWNKTSFTIQMLFVIVHIRFKLLFHNWRNWTNLNQINYFLWEERNFQTKIHNWFCVQTLYVRGPNWVRLDLFAHHASSTFNHNVKLKLWELWGQKTFSGKIPPEIGKWWQCCMLFVILNNYNIIIMYYNIEQ